MKQFTLLIISMLVTTFIFAGSKENKISPHPSMNFNPDCTQHSTQPASGSYTCDGIPYSVNVSATGTASNIDCNTAAAEAAGLAYLFASHKHCKPH